MMDFLFSLEFEYPYVFLLLVLYIVCSFLCKEKSQSIYFSNISMLKEVTKGKSLMIKVLRFFVVFFIVVALSSPVKKDTVTKDNAEGYEISLILDASGSMRDANKFGISKEMMSRFIMKRKYDKLALSIFADFAYIAVPLTYDKKSLLSLMEYIEVGVAGTRKTALYESLFLSTNLFKDSNAKERIAIILTDGFDNVKSIPKDIAIAKAIKYDVKVYTIGIGQKGTYDSKHLKEIANKTGGKFFEAQSSQKLEDIYNTIDSLAKSEIKIDNYVKKEYFYQYPLDVAIGLLFLLILLHRRFG
jgi:Ca-activated chloride channel family protein